MNQILPILDFFLHRPDFLQPCTAVHKYIEKGQKIL